MYLMKETNICKDMRTLERYLVQLDGLHMFSPGSGIWRFSLVGIGVSLCTWCLYPRPSCLEVSILIAAFRWRCRTFSSSCTMTAWMLPCSCLGSNGLNFWTCKPAPVKCCYKSCLGPGMVAHVFNPSTREAEAGGFLSSRPAWSTKWVPG